MEKKSWYWRNRDAAIQRKKEFYLSNKEKVKDQQRLTKYGVPIGWFSDQSNKQNGKCGICGVVPQKTLCVDHNHSTGEIRGLLCHDCNMALGKFKDSEFLLLRAIKYLVQHSKKYSEVSA